MIDVSQETMDQLVEKLGEEAALEFVQQAESQDQIEDVLTKPEAEHTGETNGETYGWSVVECKFKYYEDNEDGEQVEKEKMTGYCLRFKGPSRTVYCGRSQSEWPRMSNIQDPWKRSDLEHARQVCRQKAALLENTPLRKVRQISISVLVTLPELGNSPKTVQKKLTQRQQDALSTMREAYSHAPGFSVNSDSDVVAAILDLIADKMRLPK